MPRGKFVQISVIIPAILALVPGLGLPYLHGQERGSKIEIEGVPSKIDNRTGTLMLENPARVEGPASARAPFKVATTDSTLFEDRQDRRVSREQFFADLRPTDRIEVEGRLDGDTVVAREIEVED